jgi:hypothetical protein
VQPGTKYNQWEVICKESYNKVLCKCICGTEKYVRANYLKQNKSKSCGCMDNYYREQVSLEKFGTKHPNQNLGQKLKLSQTKKAFSLEKKQSIRNKRFATNLEKYGELCPNSEFGAQKNRKIVSKGTKFGYLEVIEDRSGEKNLKVVCLACDSAPFEKEYHLLQWGSENQSCGCLTKKIRVKKCLKTKQIKEYQKGRVYGYWELAEDYQHNKNGLIKVKCIGCNKVEKLINLHDLISQKTKSCGCKKQEMIEESCLKQFGVRHALQSPLIRAKVAETLSMNGTTKTSKQQLQIFEMLKAAGYKAELNKPAGVCNIDIFIELPQCNVALEYDGGGHFIYAELKEIRKKDIARDYVMIHKYGYKILRIESMKDVMPTLQDIIDKLDYLCNTERNFVHLKMS